MQLMAQPAVCTVDRRKRLLSGPVAPVQLHGSREAPPARPLARSHRIYEERQALNKRSLALLVPGAYGAGAAKASQEAEADLFEVRCCTGRWHTVQGPRQPTGRCYPGLGGRLQPLVALPSAPGAQVLQALERNLMAEQRAVSEQEYFVFKHALTPLQVGVAACVAPLPPGCTP